MVIIMAHYSDDIISEVFAENDIVDYVSKYVKLKRVGRDYSGLCPFHREKSPSFHVSGEKQLFHCFGCGASGNLVQFVMRIESLDFVEALKLLAERAGIDLPETGANDYSHELKKKIYEMNKLSARFFYDCLTKTAEGKIGYTYFAERKITNRTIIAYGLGFAPDRRTALRDYLFKQGYADKDMLTAGLVIERDGKIIDKFRNRVMFPIIDLRGNIIGFGGRIMGGSELPGGFKLPKYLNTAETPVFNKGRNLFSLNLAKKETPYSIILVEGYMDVITVFQAGMPNVAATLGTALTDEQAKLLLKYCSEIIICYDSDEPGQKAAVRAIDIINTAGGRSRVIKLKGAKDPDEYIKANGAAKFAKAVSEALPSTAFRLKLLKSKYSLDSPEGKSMYVAGAAEALLTINDAVEVDAYINQISRETQVSRDAIYAEYKKRASKRNTVQKQYYRSGDTAYSQNGAAQEASAVIPDKSKKLMEAERKLIFLMAQNKKYIDEVREAFAPEDFSGEIHKKLVRIIFGARDNNSLIEPSVIMNEFTGGEINYVSNIFYSMEEYADNTEALDELIKSIKLEKLAEQMETEKDPAKLSGLINEINRLKGEWNRLT